MYEIIWVVRYIKKKKTFDLIKVSLRIAHQNINSILVDYILVNTKDIVGYKE
jgi:hypothetical protein